VPFEKLRSQCRTRLNRWSHRVGFRPNRSMRAYLAGYTSPKIGKSGYCWVWRHPVLNEPLCMKCYAALTKPHNIASWSEENFQGGLLGYDQNWLVAYRFLNAGRDSLGRLGRFFLVVGFVRRDGAEPFSIRDALHSDAFSSISESAPEVMSLSISEFSTKSERPEEASPIPPDGGSTELKGWAEIDRAGLGCIGATTPRHFHLEIVGKSNEVTGKLRGTQGEVQGALPQENSLRARQPGNVNANPAPRRSNAGKIILTACLFALGIGVGFAWIKEILSDRPIRMVTVPPEKPQPAEATPGPQAFSKKTGNDQLGGTMATSPVLIRAAPSPAVSGSNPRGDSSI
jgi:hypothetical protein